MIADVVGGKNILDEIVFDVLRMFARRSGVTSGARFRRGWQQGRLGMESAVAGGEHRGRLELPHVETVQEEFARLEHGLKVVLARAAVLDEQEVDDRFRDRRLVERRPTEMCLD